MQHNDKISLYNNKILHQQQSTFLTSHTMPTPKQNRNLIHKLLNLLHILRIFYYNTLKSIIKNLLGLCPECHQQWARLTFQYLRVRIKEIRGSCPLADGAVMVYANHRSQGDFFIHNVIVGYRTNFLARQFLRQRRMAVLVAAPAFIVSYRTVWFFNRGKKTHPEKFNQWLDQKFKQSPRPGLLVYPQGHRMQGITKIQPQQIRTGMLKYAYRRKIPSQILISFGNEQVFDQKRLHVSFGQTVYFKLSNVIHPQDFLTENQYIQQIKHRFCQLFSEVYNEYQIQKQKTTKMQEIDTI